MLSIRNRTDRNHSTEFSVRRSGVTHIVDALSPAFGALVVSLIIGSVLDAAIAILDVRRMHHGVQQQTAVRPPGSI